MEFEKIIKLVEAVSASELTAFELEEGGMRIMLEKKPEVSGAGQLPKEKGTVFTAEAKHPQPAPVPVKEVAAPTPEAALPEAAISPEKAGREPGNLEIQAGTSDVFSEEQIVKAPLVGTFYAAPSEEAEPFVKAGDAVKKGQILGIIEAMKLMNEIESEYDGVVEAVLISNEQVVEYGQPLFRIRRKG